jgi:hypothetical protein
MEEILLPDYSLENVSTSFKSLVALDNLRILGYKEGVIYLFNIKENTYQKIVKLPQSLFWKICSKIRIFERTFRMEPRFAIKLNNDKYLISYRGAIYRISLSEKNIILEHKYIDGMNNPLNACKIQALKGFDDGVYYGEYTGNLNKSSVSVYKRNANTGIWKSVFSFNQGQINHIHNIVPDYINQRMLILTGDTDSASGIWSAKENFTKVESLLIGKQEYRACSLFPVEQGFVYATDAPLDTNSIFHCKLIKGKWKTKKLYELQGSVIYSIENNGLYYFSTTVEPDSNIKGKRFLITNKLGPGIKDRNVNVVAGNLDEGFRVIIKYKKDIYPMGLCQFGAVHFTNLKENQVMLHPIAVNDVENNLIILKRDSGNDKFRKIR